MEYWNTEKSILETVFEPAIKDPSAPTKESTSGQAPLKRLVIASAIARGILVNSDPLPDCIIILTIGTAKIRAMVGPFILFPHYFFLDDLG